MSLHTVLFFGLCVNWAMNSHSAANLKNFSEVFIVWPLCIASEQFELNVPRLSLSGPHDGCYAETKWCSSGDGKYDMSEYDSMGPQCRNAPSGIYFAQIGCRKQRIRGATQRPT
jgi:hypothetical protein